MTILADKLTDIVIAIIKNVKYDNYGNIIDEDTNTGYFTSMVYIYTDVDVPSDVVPNEYRYTNDNGFIKCDKKEDSIMEKTLKDIDLLRSDVDYLMLLNDSDSLSDSE